MPRGVIVLIVLFTLLVGGAILLSRGAKEQPTTTIEIEVPADAAPR